MLCSFLPLFCAHNVIELSALRPYRISSRKRTANVMRFPFPPRTFFIIFQTAGVRCPAPLSPPSRTRRFSELAPSRKAGAKVERFSFPAIDYRKFFKRFLREMISG